MRVAVILFGVFCVATAPAQTVFTAISNLSQTNNFGIGVNEGGAAAVSFTTTNGTASLVSVSVSLSGFDGPFETPGSFNLSICANAADPPGNTLANLQGNSHPTNSGIYTYTNTSSLILSANTTYWIVASSPSTGYEGAYSWNGTTTTNCDPGSFWTLGRSLDQNTAIPPYNWSTAAGNYYLFSVNVTNLTAFITIITAPRISISQPAASEPVVVTYAATNFPFVLQQNTTLETNNWAPVSDVILSGTNINNQVFFVLPSTATQMFYRLDLPQ